MSADTLLSGLKKLFGFAHQPPSHDDVLFLEWKQLGKRLNDECKKAFYENDPNYSLAEIERWREMNAQFKKDPDLRIRILRESEAATAGLLAECLDYADRVKNGGPFTPQEEYWQRIREEQERDAALTRDV